MASPVTIQLAAQNNQLPTVRSLLSENPKVLNSVDADERTALHWAASTGSKDVARFLIDQKADLDKPDGSGWTALHMAASAGQDEVVRELVGAGANVNCKNDKGLTPLHYAASKTRIEIGKFLVERGADINARDKANQLPLHRAATTGSTGFIQLLLKPVEGGAKPRLNTADRMGNTPLHLAMECAHAEAAAMLIEAGADRTRVNLDEQTAEELEGVGGMEQRRARSYVIDRCGKAE